MLRKKIFEALKGRVPTDEYTMDTIEINIDFTRDALEKLLARMNIQELYDHSKLNPLILSIVIKQMEKQEEYLKDKHDSFDFEQLDTDRMNIIEVELAKDPTYKKFESYNQLLTLTKQLQLPAVKDGDLSLTDEPTANGHLYMRADAAKKSLTDLLSPCQSLEEMENRAARYAKKLEASIKCFDIPPNYHILKNIAHVLASIVTLGAYPAIMAYRSSKTRDSAKFWKSDAQVAVEKVQDELENIKPQPNKKK